MWVFHGSPSILIQDCAVSIAQIHTQENTGTESQYPCVFKDEAHETHQVDFSDFLVFTGRKWVIKKCCLWLFYTSPGLVVQPNGCKYHVIVIDYLQLSESLGSLDLRNSYHSQNQAGPLEMSSATLTAQSRLSYSSSLLRSASSWMWNTSKDGDYLVSQSNLFYCLASCTLKCWEFFMLKYTLLWFGVCPLPLVLSLHDWEESVSTQ